MEMYLSERNIQTYHPYVYMRKRRRFYYFKRLRLRTYKIVFHMLHFRVK